MQKQSGFIHLLVGLIVILILVIGWFVTVIIKPHLDLSFIEPSALPQLQASPSPSVILIQEMFENYQTKELGNVPVGLDGKLIFRRAEEILMANIDGSKEEVLATIPTDLGGYAGKSGNKIYYSTYDQSDQVVYEKDILTGVIKKSFSIPIEKSIVENRGPGYLWGNVNVSPDGKYLAVAGNDGIYLFTVLTGQIKKVLSNNNKSSSSCNNAGFGCYSFHKPVWSADSQRLAVGKSVYENYLTVIFNPFTGIITANDLPGGSVFWSNNGRILAITQQPYHQGNTYIIDEGRNQKTGSLLSEKYLDLAQTYSYGGDWDDNGSFGFVSANNVNESIWSVVVYNPNDQTFQSLVPEMKRNFIPEKIDLKMLPSGKGIFLNGNQSGLWLLSAEKFKVPLPTKIDILLDII